MGKSCSCTQFIKSCIFYYTSHARIRISTASHARIRSICVPDLRKAVLHRPLVDKLANLGLDTHTLSWITSYLTNRKQHMVVGGESSLDTHVLSGVPQGSILGPLVSRPFLRVPILKAIGAAGRKGSGLRDYGSPESAGIPRLVHAMFTVKVIHPRAAT